jgi:hypothetical protein
MADSPTPEVDPETTQTFPAIEAVVVFWIARRFSMKMSSSGSLNLAMGSSSTRKLAA